MYERAHSATASKHAMREDLRRLEVVLARFQQQIEEAGRTHGATGAEMLARTGKMLGDEIDRLHKLLD